MGGGERELELKPENFLLQRGRGGRKGDQTRWRGRSVCPDCSGLVPFTMPCLFRILSSHCIYPQSGTTCRPSKYLTLFLVCFSAAAVGGGGGGGGGGEMEKREAWEECNETRASHFIRCLLFVHFQALF